MFGFKKKNKTETAQTNTDQNDSSSTKSLDEGLKKTRGGLFSSITDLFSRSKTISDVELDEMEDNLIMADVGMETTATIMETLRKTVKQKRIATGDELFSELKSILKSLLEPVYAPLQLPNDQKPAIVMMIGVNGVGKTTTIGKLAKRIQNDGKSVMLAAGDTFRAAAVEQLKVWGDRNDVSVVAQTHGSDSAAVLFDALESANAKNIDVLIADTAGRLHNKDNLMEELKKVRRVINKFNADLTPEVLLVLDSTTGQNALIQARQFHNDIGIDGIVLTKLDGTAKGGVIFALANELKIPIRFIGVGEGVDDLRVFEPASFVDALMSFDQ